MATELEIKLTLSHQAQKQAREWLLSLPDARRGPSKTLVNRYFDTPDAALNQARAALRVRQAGDRYIQTLKTRGEFINGAHQRQEWEWELAGPELDLSLLEQTPLQGRVDLGDIRLAFETNFQRQIVLLNEGRNEIEVAVDSGEILGGGQSMPLHEVEFELKGGDPACLMRNASALAAHVPVFLNLVSKAEQGYYLAGVYQPAMATPEAPVSVTELLHLLSVGWLSGKAVRLPEAVLADVADRATSLEMAELWARASGLLQRGVTINALLEQVPELGRLQLALASRG